MKLQILGPGCPKCKTLAHFTEEAAKDLGLDFTLEKITGLQQMVSFGVMATPGLVL
jgi:small redox-active disulfide protein 2